MSPIAKRLRPGQRGVRRIRCGAGVDSARSVQGSGIVGRREVGGGYAELGRAVVWGGRGAEEGGEGVGRSGIAAPHPPRCARRPLPAALRCAGRGERRLRGRGEVSGGCAGRGERPLCGRGEVSGGCAAPLAKGSRLRAPRRWTRSAPDAAADRRGTHAVRGADRRAPRLSAVRSAARKAENKAKRRNAPWHAARMPRRMANHPHPSRLERRAEREVVERRAGSTCGLFTGVPFLGRR